MTTTTPAKKVIVLGGGVAGMSAAHELVERGYTVEVFDANTTYVGGKARSINYTGNPNKPYSKPLPGEHGFRFFPGFYRHVIDTMQRIPYPNPQGSSTVADNLTHTSRIMIARYNKAPIVTVASFPKSLSDFILIIRDMHGMDSGLTTEEITFFAERVWQLATSSITRRDNDYERLGWWQYLEADRFSTTYQNLLVRGLTRTLVAARAETASTKTGGNIFLQLIYGMADPTQNVDRVLDGPTNDRWLTAWKEYLLSKGVTYHQAATVNSIQVGQNGSIQSATITIKGSTPQQYQADYYFLAVPVERAAQLINADIIKADNTLAFVQTLAPSVSWMNGIQFYLTQQADINKGHVIYSDSEWALTSISQVQFWDNYDISTKGNGNVRGVLSVDISDWQTPGRYTTTKPADQCTRTEVANEVWAQLKASLNVDGKTRLTDDMLIDWYLDRDIAEKSVNDPTANLLTNREPLLVNNVNTWGLRPNASTNIPNLFLASDYVRTNTDLATMEGANEAARRAVNCLLNTDTDASTQPLCQIWPLQEPMLFMPLRWYDRRRWKRGQPWSNQKPAWLSAAMVPWAGICLVWDLIKIIKRLFKK
jgi:uncharacterized protein with NAD-binding domain and iron-sulfur cluster